MDAAQGTFAVGRTAGPTGHVDGHGLARAMPARDRADHGEVVRTPEHDEHAGVVPGVHVQRVFTRTEASHRRIALASTDPARGRARRLPEEPDLGVGRGAVRHHRLVIRRAGRKGELLAPDGDRLGLRIVRVLVEQARIGSGRFPRKRRGVHLLVVHPYSGACAGGSHSRRRDHHRERGAGPPPHTAVLPANTGQYACSTPYTVSRCTAGRPAARAAPTRSSTVSIVPWYEPAIRLIDSSISVPPRSFTPQRSASTAASSPIFTHDACTFGIERPSASRNTAVCFRFSSREISSIPCVRPSIVWNGMNDSGTNSVIPPVRSWSARITRMCSASSQGSSTWPNITVLVERMPAAWLASITSIQRFTGSLLGEMRSRTPSCSTSAAVPGVEPRPASRRRANTSLSGVPLAIASISIGEYACMWISGASSLATRSHFS